MKGDHQSPTTEVTRDREWRIVQPYMRLLTLDAKARSDAGPESGSPADDAFAPLHSAVNLSASRTLIEKGCKVNDSPLASSRNKGADDDHLINCSCVTSDAWRTRTGHLDLPFPCFPRLLLRRSLPTSFLPSSPHTQLLPLGRHLNHLLSPASAAAAWVIVREDH